MEWMQSIRKLTICFYILQNFSNIHFLDRKRKQRKVKIKKTLKETGEFFTGKKDSKKSQMYLRLRLIKIRESDRKNVIMKRKEFSKQNGQAILDTLYLPRQHLAGNSRESRRPPQQSTSSPSRLIIRFWFFQICSN